uniref:Peroxidase n=1 Tax=Nelumbo nucifera TaxID=4432 RepID=A0A822Z410_NELNU|nr:TPA_asm: hypothetical protein HUJ06_009052 [Nelumbo nucifera]
MPNGVKAVVMYLVAILLQMAHGVDLEIGFYDKSCPSAEETVRQVVAGAYANNRRIAPGLIRMHFHDCFGCDGSVLLDSTLGNSSEKEAEPNRSLHGFQVIDDAKAMVEAQCPGVVSCADILAFAARDSASLAGKIHYRVPAGRRDGLVSIESEVITNIPSPLLNATELVGSFAAKNLTTADMVTLSGAHSVGVAHCSSFINRLYNFSDTDDIDPTLDPIYASILRSKCPSNVTSTDPTVVSLDSLTPAVLDNMYYVGLQLNRGLLTSDQALLTETSLKDLVDLNAYYGKVWDWKFAKAMVKMGGIEVLTGSDGEIRKNCRVVNGGDDSELFPDKLFPDSACLS